MRLSHTSAFVLLLLGADIYKTQAAKTYLTKLDLSAGQPLYDQMMAYWPHYDQIIKNRKHAVLQLIEILLLSGSLPHQILIAAAGMDAMGLEIAERYPGAHIYEIDEAFMDEKNKLISHPRMTMLAADMTESTKCLETLQKAGWQSERPSLVIYEGISYYLPPDALGGFNATIAPDFIIVDYHKPFKLVDTRAKELAIFCFESILGQQACADLSRFDAKDLERLFGLPIFERMSMQAMEKARMSRNHHFCTEANGWIEVSLFGKPGK
ncbi:MAG: class I SAM-dependent methyltransferase [Parvibaculales bacterium]